MSYAVMPLYDWQNILNSVRSKTGNSSTLVSSDVSAEIDSISGGYGDIPTYHYVESGRVVDNILTFKRAHPNNLVFGIVSDIHVYNADATYETPTKKSIKHAAFALETVGAMTSCDFVVNLGDNCWENGIDTDNAYVGVQYAMNALNPAFTRLTRYNLVGNHDKSVDTQKLFDLIGHYNEFDDYGTLQIRGFGYKDYTNKKVRVICLNTTDYLNSDGGWAMSYDQKDFLLRALDLSSKENSSEWQILLLSHIPLDKEGGGQFNYYEDLQTILTAYENGTTASITVNSSYALNETPSNYATYSNGKLVYNYSGKNFAKIIANIHGHMHTNCIAKLTNTDIWRISVENTCFSLNVNGDAGYEMPVEDRTALKKIAGTAADTSATFICCDLENRLINVYMYGVGGSQVDKMISYGDLPTYSVTYNLTNCTSSNSDSITIEGNSFKATLYGTDADATIENVVVTMGGIDITANCYANGIIDIAEVTGDIVITAVAIIPLWTYTVSDLAVAPRSSWGYDSTLTFYNDNYRMALGVSTDNNFGYTDREDKPIYVMQIPSKASVINITNTDGVSYKYSYSLLNIVDGILTQAIASGWTTETSYRFDAGKYSYITICAEQEGRTTAIPWGYSDSQITVEFTNGGTGSGDNDEPTDEPTEATWNISNRTAVTDLYKDKTTTYAFSNNKYYYGTNGSGLIHYGKISACSVNGNDVTLTASEKGYGIGIPYHLEAGATYVFSATCNTNGRIRKFVFNADGTFVSGSEQYSSSGTTLTLTFTAPTDEAQFVMLHLDGNTADVSHTYSNIALTKN